MYERREADLKKISNEEDFSLIGPYGERHSNSRTLQEAWRSLMPFISPLTRRTYEKSDWMREAEEKYRKQYNKKIEIDK